jgi:hypothetical protein
VGVYSGSADVKISQVHWKGHIVTISAATDGLIELKGYGNPVGASALLFGCSRVKDLARIPANSPMWLLLCCPISEVEEMPSFLY